VDDRVLFVHGSTGVLLDDAVEESFDYFRSAPGITSFEFPPNSCPCETGSEGCLDPDPVYLFVNVSNWKLGLN
jgi:hypothetical protein